MGATSFAPSDAQVVITRSGARCTHVHRADENHLPGDNPETLAQRAAPLNPVLNTSNSIFDDKMAVVNASLRGDIRGTALPLLLDLARKPNFLHDNSVASMDELLNPSRGATAPHPFYLTAAADRAAMAAYLRSLSTSSK